MAETAAPATPVAAGLLDGLVEGLSAGGVLGANWRAAFRAVPRYHEFVVTQINDGAGLAASADVYYTSSTSMPPVVAEMLAALRVEPGMSVLEIGTGTGWNAALLAHRLGGANLTSVEIDPGIAAQVRTALADAGYGAVTVTTGDGTLGHLSRAPYDRVLSTACVYRVPYSWIAQTRPGGLLVMSWATEYYNGHLLTLTVRGDGSAWRIAVTPDGQHAELTS